MVDFYFRSGKRYREVYYVMKALKNGEWHKAWVQTERKENQPNNTLATVYRRITEEALAKLNEAVEQPFVPICSETTPAL